MTTFEHAMLAIDGSLAVGLHRRYGWQVSAVAAVTAISPDWDGLPILWSVRVFDQVHRLWGHNLLACVLVGVLIGSVDYRFDLATRSGRILTRFLRVEVDEKFLQTRNSFTRRGLCVWILVAIVAALTQLPADMVVSGTSELSDWGLKPFWPFWEQTWVFPMVPWGDVGITLVFAAGMFAKLVWRSHVQLVASLTLVFVVVYIVIRGMIFV